MILTGKKILDEINNGHIHISPFNPDLLNPNSYDFTLGSKILTYKEKELDAKSKNITIESTISNNGMLLVPGKLYLGHTNQIIGSDRFVPIIKAKSSIARLGLFVHITADLIDLGYLGQFTLQLNPVMPLRVYPDMKIGQVTFWHCDGDIVPYSGKYQGSSGPSASKSYTDFIEQEVLGEDNHKSNPVD